MPRAGVFVFPSRDLDDCLGFLRRARDVSGSRSTTREGFARAVGQSLRGGGFGKLVAAMSAYGLVETGRGTITTTELCEKILYGEPTEQSTSMERSVRNVRLFNDILDAYGESPSDEQLRVFLREKAKMDVAGAKRTSAEMGRLLRKNSAHVQAGGSTRASVGWSTSGASGGGMVARLETSDYGVLNIRDRISMDLAIELLVQVKKSKGWGSPGRSALPAHATGPVVPAVSGGRLPQRALRSRRSANSGS